MSLDRRDLYVVFTQEDQGHMKNDVFIGTGEQVQTIARSWLENEKTGEVFIVDLRDCGITVLRKVEEIQSQYLPRLTPTVDYAFTTADMIQAERRAEDRS